MLFLLSCNQFAIMFPCDGLFSSPRDPSVAHISIMLIFYGPIIDTDITTFLKKKKKKKYHSGIHVIHVPGMS